MKTVVGIVCGIYYASLISTTNKKNNFMERFELIKLMGAFVTIGLKALGLNLYFPPNNRRSKSALFSKIIYMSSV